MFMLRKRIDIPSMSRSTTSTRGKLEGEVELMDTGVFLHAEERRVATTQEAEPVATLDLFGGTLEESKVKTSKAAIADFRLRSRRAGTEAVGGRRVGRVSDGHGGGNTSSFPCRVLLLTPTFSH